MPNLNLYTAPVAAYTMIFMNQGDDALPFFQNQQVRQALLLSLDRQKMIEGVLHGQGLIADSPIIPGTWAYAGDLPQVLPNVEQARQLLNQAGWRFPSASQPAVDKTGESIAPTPTATPKTKEPPVRVKDGVPISFTLYTKNDPIQVALAESIAAQWLEVGVRASVVPVQAGLVSNYLAPRTYQAALVEVQLPNDPDQYPFWHETQAAAPGQNYSQFKDRDVSEVLEQARRAADLQSRIDQYRKFQEMFIERVPGILIYYPVYTYAVREKVVDVQIGPIAHPADRFRTLPDWYVITRRVIASNTSRLK
jgi:peptide/nickel transport system substrate-binding protein